MNPTEQLSGRALSLGRTRRAAARVLRRRPPRASDARMASFDPARFAAQGFAGHARLLGVGYHAHGPDWVELLLPYDPALVGDTGREVTASGAIVALMDMATSMAIWVRRDRFVAQATLDLRVDYLRAATPGRTVIGRGECYRVTRQIAFVRGQAHDGDANDPMAHVAGTFMMLDAGA